ncbi:hypothetical protein BCR44DRAFT_37526 [Catenaria anguillulae PL171]|uniref:Pentacotripeptide-repeat region of PRORP domain-containing protein n=1 Tax=Catenaria anguillulae PL171 TaxID=765915 RepID=A0A1Y2HV25_9FUNG|nr:hypothetical protein BCR44DRAFT_37526 [Catenaria anguillulae PL171]
MYLASSIPFKSVAARSIRPIPGPSALRLLPLGSIGHPPTPSPSTIRPSSSSRQYASQSDSDAPSTSTSAPTPFPSHYLQNTIVLDTRNLSDPTSSSSPAASSTNESQQHRIATLDKRTARVAVDLHSWATSANSSASSTPTLSASSLLDSLHHALLDNARAGRAEVVDKLYQLARASNLPGLDADARIHNDRLLSLCRTPSEIDNAVTLFHSLMQSNVANAYSLSILCDGLVKHGRTYRALELLDEWTLGTIPQPAFTSILAGLARVRDTQRAWQLFHRMQMHYTLPDEVTYSTMISLCAQSGQVEKALSLFDQLRASPGMFPTTTTINALLLAMAKRKDYAGMAVDFYAQCLAAGFVPDAYSMAYLMQAARKAQDWEGVGRGVWSEAVERGLVSPHVCVQALWTISVDQVRTGKQWNDDVQTVLAAALGEGFEDSRIESVELANAYLATFFPYRGDQGLEYFFNRMQVKNGMSFRLALQYCMDDFPEPKSGPASSSPSEPQADNDEPDLDPVSSFDKSFSFLYSDAALSRRARGIDVWAAWEAWYTSVLKSCAAHVAHVRATDSAAAPEHIIAEAFLAKHTMTRQVLYRLVCTAVNGIAVDYPKKALALLLKYAKQYQFKVDKGDLPRLDWSVRRAGMVGRARGESELVDAELVQRQWDAILEVYGKKEGDLEKSLKRLKGKWNRVHK